MLRRDVLKGIATVPFLGTFAGCEEEKKEESHKWLEVHLYGAFAVVVQAKKGNSILAFSPRPKTGEKHAFYFNGSTKPEDLTKPQTFHLVTEGREKPSKPDISPGLRDFFFHTERWRVGDSLVTIELPPPDQITFSGPRSPVYFKEGNRAAFMPLNHILKYEVRGNHKFTLECSDKALKCVPSADSYPGVDRFFFEIGPQRILNLEESHAHALAFFNYILQQSFPDLYEKLQLAIPNQRGNPQAFKLDPGVFHPGMQEPRLLPSAYVIDCELSGPLVSTNTSASG